MRDREREGGGRREEEGSPCTAKSISAICLGINLPEMVLVNNVGGKVG
jgi:hypothetical protein